MSKKIRRKALLQVLSQKAKDLEILGVDSLNFEKPKTKDFVKMLNAIGLKEGKILFVLDERNPNVEKSVSNLKRCSLISFRDLNALDVLRSDRVVFTRGALEKFCEVAAGYASSV
jgi:large subunit ribosomal protein L4